ncbi:MAG: ABC transporter permease subunit [Clostridiales bacterium]|nr:ABC transporter permease subunit [Clostridiales bacterium]
MKKRWMKLLAVAIWLAIWFIVAIIINDSFKFPGPVETLNALFGNIISGDGFFRTVLTSLLRILLGLAGSFILGLVLGVAAGIKKGFADFLEPIVTVIKSTPVMSFIILAMIWFKFSTVPIIICFLMCFPIIYSNIREGISQTDKKLLDMAKLYKVKPARVIQGIYLKSVKPYFYSAANICLGLGFKVTVAAEVLASPDYGIGSRLYDAKIYLEPVEVFAWTFVILVLSYLLEQLLKFIFRDNKKGALANGS